MPANATLFVDESGDLGWSLDKSFLQGGSSRYLTIAGVIVVDGNIKHLNRLIRSLYASRRWNTKREKKWSQMTSGAKMDFATRAARLSETRRGISFHSISVYKTNVREHIRRDGNKLYNYMIGLLFLQHLQHFDRVTFIPDERSIKVTSGDSLHDYLQTQLWFDKNAETMLTTRPGDSAKHQALQFADMLAGCVQDRYEKNQTAPFDQLGAELNVKRLFFP